MKRAGVVRELFSDRGAFLTGDGANAEIPLKQLDALHQAKSA